MKYKKTIITLLIPFIIAAFNEIYYQMTTNSYGGLILSSMIFIIMCTYLLFTLFFMITKKTYYSTIILGTISLLISFFNQVKIAFTNDPIHITDILFINTTNNLYNYINGIFLTTIKPLTINTIIYIIAIIIIIRNSKTANININNNKLRIPISIIILLFFTILIIPNKTIDNFILTKVFAINNRRDYIAVNNTIQYNNRFGSINGIYVDMLENRFFEPDNYNEKNINKIVKNSTEEKNKDLGTPNIIVIFSESFWDVDQLEEIKFNKKITPNFNKLKEKGLFFNMVSPTYGGTSANVEFEFLTGASMTYFNQGYIPYMQLYNKQHTTPSIITELKKNDYYTQITTAESPDLFGCDKVYKNFKVDKTTYLDKISKKYKKGYYISDQYVTDLVIKNLNNKEKDKKLFYMAITMQAHMPYLIDKYYKYDIDITKSKLNKNEQNTIKSYAQGIYDADKELGRLYEFITNYNEPTIIIFYGDHLPLLNCDGKNVINNLEYFNTNDINKNLYRMYNTQALIISNYDIDSLKKQKEEEKIDYLSPDLLSAYVLNHMNIEIDNYYKYIYNIKDKMAASNKYITLDNNGIIYSNNNLKSDIKDIYNERKMIQYKYFIK